MPSVSILSDNSGVKAKSCLVGEKRFLTSIWASPSIPTTARRQTTLSTGAAGSGGGGRWGGGYLFGRGGVAGGGGLLRGGRAGLFPQGGPGGAGGRSVRWGRGAGGGSSRPPSTAGPRFWAKRSPEMPAATPND